MCVWICSLMLPVRPSWTLADVSTKRNPTHQLSLTEPCPLGRAGFQSLVSEAGDAGSRDPAQDLKRRELEKTPKRLNRLWDAHFAVTCLPAVHYDMLALHPLLWIMLEFGIGHSVTLVWTQLHLYVFCPAYLRKKNAHMFYHQCPRVITTVRKYVLKRCFFSCLAAPPPQCVWHCGIIGITRRDMELYYRNIPR